MTETPGFARFWAVWPRNTAGGYSRKGSKQECIKLWLRGHHETQTDTICKHVAWLSTTADWLKDAGMYIPAPAVYLRQQRWTGADIPEPEPTSAPATNGYLADLAAHKAQATTGTPEQRQKLEALRNGSVLKRIA